MKIRTYSADPLALLEQAQWLLKGVGDRQWTAFRPLEGRTQGTMLVAAIAGVESRDQAEALRQHDVAVPRAALPAAGPGEVYWADLTGLAVVNRNGEMLGTVVGLMDNGAHPILRVAQEGDGVERLLPFVPAYVDRVDLEARRIDVDWRKDY